MGNLHVMDIVIFGWLLASTYAIESFSWGRMYRLPHSGEFLFLFLSFPCRGYLLFAHRSEARHGLISWRIHEAPSEMPSIIEIN